MLYPIAQNMCPGYACKPQVAMVSCFQMFSCVSQFPASQAQLRQTYQKFAACPIEHPLYFLNKSCLSLTVDSHISERRQPFHLGSMTRPPEECEWFHISRGLSIMLSLFNWRLCCHIHIYSIQPQIGQISCEFSRSRVRTCSVQLFTIRSVRRNSTSLLSLTNEISPLQLYVLNG